MHLESPNVSQRLSRKGKERDSAYREPQDLADKIIAHRRKNAGATRIRDKAERDAMQSTPAASASQNSLVASTNRTERSSKPSTLAPSSSRQTITSPRRPHAVASKPPVVEADHEDFSRRLKISSSTHSPRLSSSKPHASSKLYNPETDTIPLRRTAEPEQLSDATGSSYVHVPRPQGGAQHQQREDRSTGSRQLFDHRKDDPVRFSVLTRPSAASGSTPHQRAVPTPKLSGDHISASSGSSYAPSVSSSFTLSSTTDGSSTSSKLFDGRPGAATDDSGTTAYADQLKRLYRTITGLETKVKQEETNAELMDESMSSRVLLKGKETANTGAEQEKWRKQINAHKLLAETMHSLLTLSLNPKVPASLRSIPTKYNIVFRLWNYGFHKILENLRRASFTSPVALELLQEFIYYAYTFYAGLLEEQRLSDFKQAWLEALGDLARYAMAVTALVNSGVAGRGGLTTEAVSEAANEAAKNSTPSSSRNPAHMPNSLAVPEAEDKAKSVSEAPAARIDDSPSPSVGIVAARQFDLEPEKERWRNVARQWYGAGLADQPGTGKLHHHLGWLSREVESEELRAVYHFTKSMITLHPFLPSRESVLPMWAHGPQARRALPDARVSELFILLHGMLFTNIQLDDFQPTLVRFIERLNIEGAEEKEWIMMAIINISSIMEYGRPSSLMRRLGVSGPKEPAGTQQAATIRVMAKKAAAGVPGAVAPSAAEDMMDVDGEREVPRAVLGASYQQMTPPSPSAELPDCPPALNHAMQLTFAMLSLVLKRPLRQASQHAPPTLNPYITVMLTFLSTILKQDAALQVLERSVPWEDLAAFFETIPRKVMASQGLTDAANTPDTGDRWVVTAGVSPPLPLPEDWCMRGMEWVGRKVFERGYWKAGEDRKAELEVIEQLEGIDTSDGMIEDDDDDVIMGSKGGKKKVAVVSELERRWVRIARAAVSITGVVDGLSRTAGTREWRVEGKLKRKVELWKEEERLERLERLEEERRRMGRRWTYDPMEVDEEAGDVSSESEEDNEDDSEEINALKARRRQLKALLASAAGSSRAPGETSRPRARSSKRSADSTRPALSLVPGYTILVVDTNIILSSLSMITSLIESQKWTVVVPLPVIMELDGLTSSVTPQLAEAATAAIMWISAHIRTHSSSLKVQTSKGNYLSSLNVRTEEVDFSAGMSNERSMDDLILKAAIWQDEHWQDRSAMLKADAVSPEKAAGAVKVAFLSLDRNLRLKARSRQLAAASEKDLAALMAFAT